jgi:translation initiation factor 2 subunit 3
MSKEETSAISIGLVGHVDTGKTTLTEAFTGKWTDTHSEELKRGITIRLGYADVSFYKSKDYFTADPKDKEAPGKLEFLRKVSFIDAPGHETLMATMLSGAAIMDAALLLISANEECPQPQTREHLMALEIIGIKNILIVQNKIDLVSEKQAKKNHDQIKKFVKGTIAEKSPIIPISAQHRINMSALIEAIQKNFVTPKRTDSKDPQFFIARSFDVNKPGTDISKLNGGVLGGSMNRGELKKGDEIEIRPGLQKQQGKWEPVFTTIKGFTTGGEKVDSITPGGSAGILTELDPTYVKTDSLSGNIAGLKGQLPEVYQTISFKPTLLKRVVGVKDDLLVDNIKKGEVLMLNVNAAATVGQVTDTKKNIISLDLKIPVCMEKEDRVTISRQIGARWRLIGYGVMA